MNRVRPFAIVLAGIPVYYVFFATKGTKTV